MPPNRNFGFAQGNNMPVYSSRIRRSPNDAEEKSCRTQSEPKKTEASTVSASPNILENLFGKDKPDFERIILVVLIILLAKDGADLTLLIALGYLLI
ncbi:MAG: hypothetical protein IJO29_08215 [Oscillospiraceae bacterium]|nr:hypothetical protein [Oscillospiraceae bacterium]